MFVLWYNWYQTKFATCIYTTLSFLALVRLGDFCILPHLLLSTRSLTSFIYMITNYLIWSLLRYEVCRLLSPGSPYTQDSSPVIMVFMNSGSLCGVQHVLGVQVQWKSDKSTKHYLTQMLLVINWRYWQAGKIHARVWRLKVASCKLASLKFAKFSQKKVGYFSSRVVFVT